MKIQHIKLIEAFWDSEADDYAKDHLEHFNASLHPSWGLWHTPESELRIFEPEEIFGKVIVDLGCGHGQDSVGFAKLGAKVIGVDISQRQLKNAIECKDVSYIKCSAETLPLPDSCVDIVISDHGAFDHTPAPSLLKEVGRVLKPGGSLVICTYTPLSYITFDPVIKQLSVALHSPYPRAQIRSDGVIVNCEYSYSAWIEMFSQHKFKIVRLEELLAPPNANEYFSKLVTREWSVNWPCDLIWKTIRGE